VRLLQSNHYRFSYKQPLLIEFAGNPVSASSAKRAEKFLVLQGRSDSNSNGAIINWQQFNIGAGETTRFIQPTASSAVLNRVLAADPSLLYGTLASNGKVFLVNPAGILVGAGARIDTAGFVASTLAIKDSDFLAGKLSFGQIGAAANGLVSNQGTITTVDGGSVYLIGANVSNQGIIHTPGGEAILAAGQTVQLVDTATPGVKVEITGAW
jgi:filamentous hemagglutinin family protein